MWFFSIFLLLGIFDGYSFHRLGHISVSIFSECLSISLFSPLSWHSSYPFIWLSDDVPLLNILHSLFLSQTLYIWFDSFPILYDSLIMFALSFNFLKQRERIHLYVHVYLCSFNILILAKFISVDSLWFIDHMILLVGMSENFFFNLMADIVNCEFYTIGYCYFCIPINVLSLS